MTNRQGLWSAKTSGIALLLEAVICGVQHEWVYLTMSMIVATISIAASFWHRMSFALAPMLIILASWLLYLHIRATSCVIPYLIRVKKGAVSGDQAAQNSTSCEDLNFGRCGWEAASVGTILPLVISNIMGLLINLVAIVASTITIYKAKDKLTLRKNFYDSIRRYSGGSKSPQTLAKIDSAVSSQETSSSLSSDNKNPTIIYLLPSTLPPTTQIASLDHRSSSRSQTTVSLDENLSDEDFLDDGLSSQEEFTETLNARAQPHEHSKGRADEHSIKYNIIPVSSTANLSLDATARAAYTPDLRFINVSSANIAQVEMAGSSAGKWRNKRANSSRRALR